MVYGRLGTKTALWLAIPSLLFIFALIAFPGAYAQAAKEDTNNFDGYTLAFSDTTCNGNVCTLSIGADPVVRNPKGEYAPVTELLWLDILPGGGLNASLRGRYPMTIMPYVEICVKKLCQNLSVASDILQLKNVAGANWTFETTKKDLGDRWEYAFNLSDVPVEMGKLVLKYAPHPYLDLSFDDARAAGLDVKDGAKEAVIVLTKDTKFIDPTITLNGGNITDDSHMSERDPTNEFGADDDLVISGDWTDVARQYPIVRFGGLNLIPRGSVITNATVQMYIEYEALDGAAENWTVYAYHVYQPPNFTVGGSAWTEGNTAVSSGCIDVGANATGTEISWTGGPWLATQGNISYDDSKTIYMGSTGVWNIFNVTGMVQREYTQNNSNVSINFEVGYVGTPDDTDCARYASSEASTAAQRPRLNVTYNISMPKWSLNQTNTTVAEAPTLFSVNWTAAPPNTTMSGFFFQFCNGTWNGTYCLPYIPRVTTTITLQSPTGENLEDLAFRNDTGTKNWSSQVKWNISSIPASSNNIDAKLCLWVQRVYAGSTLNANVRIWRVNDQKWNESASPAYITAQPLTNQTDMVWNATPTSFTWVCLNATNAIATDYTNGNVNSTIRFANATYTVGYPTFKASSNFDGIGMNILLAGTGGAPGVQFSDRENATASYRPVLYITYSNANATPEAWVNNSFAYFSGSTWSNVTKTVNSTLGANIAWRVYANSTGNGGDRWNVTDVFNYTTTSAEAPPTPDASFNVSMPSDYAWIPITGTEEGTATATADISFNFTDLGENFTQPFANGIAGDAQSGTALPIFYINTSGNIDNNYSLRIDPSWGATLVVMANASCTDADICQSVLQSLTTSYVTLVNGSAPNSFVNITLYANVSRTAMATVDTGSTLYILGED